MTREEFEQLVEECNVIFHSGERNSFSLLKRSDKACVHSVDVNLVIVIINKKLKKAVVGDFLHLDVLALPIPKPAIMRMFNDLFEKRVLGDHNDWDVYFIGYSDFELGEEELVFHRTNLAYVAGEFIKGGFDFTKKIEWVRPDENEHLSVYIDMKRGLQVFQSDVEAMREWAFWDEHCGPVTEDEQIDAGVSDPPDEE